MAATSATTEWSFSTLYNDLSMYNYEAGNNHFMIICIHQDREIVFKDVMEEFVHVKGNRLTFFGKFIIALLFG